MWAKIKRYQDRLNTETDPNIVKDIKAIISGMSNFFIRSRKFNQVANQRLKDHCSGCAYFITDPVEDEKVKDKDIPGLSGKICSLCGCTSSYKLRQSIKKCEFWK